MSNNPTPIEALTPEQISEIRDLYKHRGPIDAIKYLRRITNLGLKEAKDAIDGNAIIPPELRPAHDTRSWSSPARTASPPWDAAQERKLIVKWLTMLANRAQADAPDRADWYRGVADDLEFGNATLDALRAAMRGPS